MRGTREPSGWSVPLLLSEVEDANYGNTAEVTTFMAG